MGNGATASSSSGERDSRLAIFGPSPGDGGVDRMLVNLARGLTDLGLRVDFIVSSREGPFLSFLPPQVHVVELGTSHPWGMLLPLARYLRQAGAAVLLSAKRSHREALRARRLASVGTRIYFRIGTTTSRRDSDRSLFRRWRSSFWMRRLYPRADGIIAVSRGVAEDIAAITGIPPEKVHVVPNPVVFPELTAMAASPPDHPWFTSQAPPVMLGAGGLRQSKDFATLIRAFARVRAQRSVRLVILGEGRQRLTLENLAMKLGVGKDVSLPGFVANPYAYMARAGVFVLSSLWEGSPNVLVEALAVGTPVVSTDCRSGPRDILQDGMYGPLVPVGDVGAMAEAILQTLDNRLPEDVLKGAVAPYKLQESTERYLQAFGIMSPWTNHR